jgi:phage shock protein E
MSEQKNATGDVIVWIDVRTPEEYAIRNIEGHVNIPHEQILDGVEKLGITLDQQVMLYCRTGRRSAIAAAVMAEKGFANVENAGSIDSVRDDL